jgi:hypothetical protein
MEDRLHLLTARWSTVVAENKVPLPVRCMFESPRVTQSQTIRGEIEEERKDHVLHLAPKL